MKETIRNYEDVLLMLDSLLREPAVFWDTFYSDRQKGVPFFVNKPDENLTQYVERGLLQKGKVLELGCGPGRNAIYLAENGWSVDAVDLSEQSLQWAEERAKEKQVSINFLHKNIFELETEADTYDLVYDSGCFHHIAPHRRLSYLELVRKSLKPGGHYAITCFEENGPLGGSDMSDWEVYRIKSLQGGLGFTKEKLRQHFEGFEEIEIRQMKEKSPREPVFGKTGLWTALFKG